MKKILGVSLILIGIFSGGMGIAVMGGGLAIPGFLVIAFGIYFLFSSSVNKHKKLSSILLALAFLIGGNAYAENITIKCVDKKRDAQLILNFDEGGDWLMFNGREKDVATKNRDGT